MCPSCHHEFSLDHRAKSPRSRHSAVAPRPPSQRPSFWALDTSTRLRSSISSSRSTTTPNFLVAGGTGVGKSLFISLQSNQTGRTAKVGSELASCTSTVERFPCVMPDGSRYNLIDSPGFDDSRMPDAEVLTMLANFIVDLYTSGQEVHGVVFVHRITDVRLSGSQIKTAQILRRITGDKFRGRFALVTSMWDLVEDRTDAISRESELVRHPQFWKELRPDDLEKFRFSGTVESARKVVNWFLKHGDTFLRHPPQLRLYTQLEAGKLVSETDAGIFVMGEMSKQRQEHVEAVEQLRREIFEARQERDQDAVEIYSEMQAREISSIRQKDMMLRKMRLQTPPKGSVYA
jgi:GTP-binding protein EngB required for normal cell division